MADQPKRRSKAERDDREIVEEAQKRHHRVDEFESRYRQNVKLDLLMETADSYNMNAWPIEAIQARQPAGGTPRPCLTFNLIQQHNLHVTNNAQQNQMGIKVNATGFGATSEAADAIEGLIRHIEYQSNAQQNAYMTAIKWQVGPGRGYTHYETDYATGDTFDQELYIRSVPDPRTVWLDCDCREPDKSDAKFGFIGIDMPRKEFDLAFPDQAKLDGVQSSFGEAQDWNRDWAKKDAVRVMKYYRLTEKDDTLYAIPDGVVLPGETDEDGQPLIDPMTGQPVAGTPVAPGVMRASAMPDVLVEIAKEYGFRSRPIADPRVEWFLIAGHEIIDRGDTVFDHIPLVAWIGQEVVVDGKFDCWGHTRLQIDSQRMFNYAASEAVGLTALQSRAPWMGDVRAFEGHEDSWANANTSAAAFLPYNATDPDTGQPIAPPQRLDPPSSPGAALQAMANAEHQMQLVSGQYDSEMGAPGNERTGVAIQQRQRQGETATYHFTDRQGAALRLSGKILLSAIPRVYDTQRAAQILALDGTRKGVVIDPTLATAHQEVPPPPAPPGQPAPDPDAKAILAINPTIGRYDVQADVGPAYGTRRQEAFNAITQILGSAPELVGKIGDLLFKAADFPLSDEIAERLAPAGDDPNVSAANQALQQAHAQIAQLNQKLADKTVDQQIKIGDQQHDKVIDLMRIELDNKKADTDRLAAVGSIAPPGLMPVLVQAIQQALHDNPDLFGASQAAPNQPGSATGPSPQPMQLASPRGAAVTPQGTDVPRMPSTNPPGGLIHAPVPSNGAVQ